MISDVLFGAADRIRLELRETEAVIAAARERGIYIHEDTALRHDVNDVLAQMERLATPAASIDSRGFDVAVWSA